MATDKLTRFWIRRSTSMLVGLVMAVSAVGFAGGSIPSAQAAPAYHWCPGDFWDPGWSDVYNWDWNRCHDWQRPGGPYAPVGWGPWGPPPGWAPPRPPQPAWAPGAQLMYNPTANSWGFWNNGIWTPV